MKSANNYTIYPILTCKQKISMGHFTYRTNYDKWIMIPIFAFLVKGGNEPFLIDTGCRASDMKAYIPPPAWHGGEEGLAIEDSLKQMGVPVPDVKTIVLTHMHPDHILNAKKFPNAKFIVQEKELSFARNPHPLFSGTYHPDFFKGLNFETINGDTEIMPGIKAILTPGHSPGCQSVSIATEQGKMLLCGYCSVDECFTEKGDAVVGMHTNLFDAYDSMLKVRKSGETIIPLHSQRLMAVKSIP